jgi:hypothetical protein
MAEYFKVLGSIKIRTTNFVNKECKVNDKKIYSSHFLQKWFGKGKYKQHDSSSETFRHKLKNTISLCKLREVRQLA